MLKIMSLLGVAQLTNKTKTKKHAILVITVLQTNKHWVLSNMTQHFSSHLMLCGKYFAHLTLVITLC